VSVFDVVDAGEGETPADLLDVVGDADGAEADVGGGMGTGGEGGEDWGDVAEGT